ncbi:MAG TPA: tRNA 2-thiouridine(34) synthase MnmA [Thermoanaerobaculia bacterium]|nr:tRNA 2-thiouridine(34) synthase MnmA [Thermoanaerobaculia bacterium]
MTLTAVAMSGGLDSSVTAWMLAKSGVPVVGLSMLLWDQSGVEAHGRCCGALDLGDAKRVAQQAGIPHYTLRLDEEFRQKVVDPFVEDYLAGRTPSPCVRCNTWIKFDLLLERARRLGAERVATGHYARIVDGPGGPELHTALDTDKDQSYYLFELTQEQLAASLFPLGGMTKPQVRDLAREAGLVVAEKGESMEVCFVSGGIREFVEAQVAEHPERFSGARLSEPAALVDSGGREVGAGQPYYRYTVGQRRGLGLAARSPLFVLAIEPDENRVVVGEERELLAPGLLGERLHWIGQPAEEVTVKIRSRHPGVAARVRALPEGKAEVLFAEAQRGITPGQAAVFYQGTRVLGGCWIEGRLG